METISRTSEPLNLSMGAPGREEPRAPSLDLRLLHRQIASILKTSQDAGQMAANVTAFVARLTNAQLVIFFTVDPSGRLNAAAERQGTVPDELRNHWREILARQSTLACAENRLHFTRLPQNRVSLSVPVERHGAASEALAAVFLLGEERIESFVVILQLIAGLLATCHLEHQVQASDWEARTACAILDLIVRLGDAAELREACVLLVNAVKDYLGCQRVAMGMRKRRRSQCKLLAISGMSELNLRAEMPLAVQSALLEAARGGDWAVWPAAEGTSEPMLPAHTRLSALSGHARVCSAPVRGVDGSVVGAWIFWGLETAEECARAERFARVSSAPVGTALQLLHSGQLNPVRRLLRKWRLFERKAFWLTLAGVFLLLFSFWPYRISCECSLEPVKRRYVVAPFAGVFEKSFVRPGDVVTENQKLAQMDGRELRMELAGVVADYQQARKSHDVNLAAGKAAAAQIDALEMQRLDQKRRLLESRMEHLEIKSPEAGIVVSGDLERSEGAPVTVGQALYEIAPLDRMIVEVEIRDEDIAEVEVGQKVAVRLDAYPGKVWKGRIDKIHPRSEIRDSNNVFLGEVSLNEGGEVLRPGMKGSATITTSSHTLLWILFHKAWYTVLRWLGR
jgi:hypothetical protein